MTDNFLRGFIDGTLATLGIVIGALSASPPIIIAAAVGGTLANGISNILSAFSAEGAVRYAELREIERAMVVRRLHGNAFAERAIRRESLKAGMSDGAGTIVGGAIPILPFVVAPDFYPFFTAIGLVAIFIALVGIYLGKISKKNLVFSAIRMVIFALAIAGIVYLVESIIVPR